MPQNEDQEATFAPDLLIIPALVAFDTELQPVDKLVYAVVYWFERLKDGRCYASNATIAKIVDGSVSSVRQGLYRLEDQGHIHMTYDAKKHRTGIVTLVQMRRGVANATGGVSQTRHRDSNTKSTYTSEMQEKIEKVYKAWVVYMVLDPGVRDHGTPEEKRTAYAAGTKRVRLTEKRRAAIARRLADYDTPELIKAVRNLSNSPFHRDGSDDSNWRATIEWLFKSYEKVEEWINKDAD